MNTPSSEWKICRCGRPVTSPYVHFCQVCWERAWAAENDLLNMPETPSTDAGARYDQRLLNNRRKTRLAYPKQDKS